MRPDIWTAATPVIIQEAALNGSADNRGDICNNIIIIIINICDYLSSSKGLNGSADNEGEHNKLALKYIPYSDYV